MAHPVATNDAVFLNNGYPLPRNRFGGHHSIAAHRPKRHTAKRSACCFEQSFEESACRLDEAGYP